MGKIAQLKNEDRKYAVQSLLELQPVNQQTNGGGKGQFLESFWRAVGLLVVFFRQENSIRKHHAPREFFYGKHETKDC